MKTWTIRCGNNCETRNSSENIQDRGKQKKKQKKQEKQEKQEKTGSVGKNFK